MKTYNIDTYLSTYTPKTPLSIQTQPDSVISYAVYLAYQAYSDAFFASDCSTRGHKFESQFVHIPFLEIDHEIISMVILLPYTDSRRAAVR